MIDSACVFCAIVTRTAPSHVIHEDEHTLAFLDIAPLSQGHTLVVPKRHARTLLDLEPAESGQVMIAAHRVAQLLDSALSPQGFTLLQANEAVGWQTVFHVHVHVIPRWDDDGIGIPTLPSRDPGDLTTLARRITG
jgi:histidine triad (HIT) family protein